MKHRGPYEEFKREMVRWKDEKIAVHTTVDRGPREALSAMITEACLLQSQAHLLNPGEKERISQAGGIDCIQVQKVQILLFPRYTNSTNIYCQLLMHWALLIYWSNRQVVFSLLELML